MRIAVDRSKCAGMGICEALDPGRFEVQADGKMQVVHEAIDDDEALEVAREAVDSCPTASLRIVD